MCTFYISSKLFVSNEKMPASFNFEQNLTMGKDRDSAAQTTLSGNTVYSLPSWSARRNMVDLVLMIMDEDGPMPMHNMRPAKKTRTAADQFDDEQQGVYEARCQPPRDQIERVHTHNNAYPKMYDELEKRRSIAQVGISGFDTRQMLNLTGTATYSSNSCNSSDQSAISNFDPTCPNCPKCFKRKKRSEEERKKKGRNSKKCKDKRSRKESKNKLDRVTKQSHNKPRKQQSRTCRSTTKSRPCVMCSNKCFQCYLAAETKSVSTFKSTENLLKATQPEITPTSLTSGINIQESYEKIVLNSKSSHKKRLGKKPGSTKSEENPPDAEPGPSVSSYNSFMSTEHEPMIE